jgi:hypothetical protein
MREGKNMGIMTTFKKPTLESPPGGGRLGWGGQMSPSPALWSCPFPLHTLPEEPDRIGRLCDRKQTC